MKYRMILLACLLNTYAQAQSTKRALFLGNSYTAVNNLPQLVYNIGMSVNDTLVNDSNTPGGHTFQQHFGNTISKTKIMAGNWDYVVLQEQSQLPSFPISQVNADVFPYAEKLDSMIHQYNACAKTMFYMTWGRKNGDASNCSSWPPVCTYGGMDSLLRLRYTMMADDNAAELSPVGAVWKYIRQHYPAIELYQADESHPSAAGSYAAACCFYTSIFRKSPMSVTYNYSLSGTDAASIRNAVKLVVFDSLLHWNTGAFEPIAAFTQTAVGTQVNFNNTSLHSGVYAWNFGDGNTSTATNPVHTYAVPGTYTVQLIAGDCENSDTITQNITVTSTGLTGSFLSSETINVWPNPCNGSFLQFDPGTVIGKDLNLTIFDRTGRICFEGSYQANGNTVNIVFQQKLSPGIYILHLQGEKIFTQKLVVQ